MPATRYRLNCVIMHAVKLIRILILISIGCVLLTPLSCKRADRGREDRLRILVTVAPVYSFTVNVAGNAAAVDYLLPSGAGPHEYSLSPGDAKKIEDAGVIVINGAGLEPWLAKSVVPLSEARRDGTSTGSLIIDSSRGIELIDNDPHTWLSPLNAVSQVKNIMDGLVAADPGNAAVYRKNAVSYIARLTELDREIRASASKWGSREFVSYHPAFAYFAREYGLIQAGVIQESHEAMPSPSHIADIMQVIKDHDIRSIFTEPRASARMVNSIAHDLDIKVYSLDTLESGGFSAQWYEDKMIANLSVLNAALRGGK